MHSRVDVWIAGIDVPDAAVGALASLLDDEERAMAARFHFDADRRRCIVARGALRTLLGRSLGRHARALRFVRGAQGKPALEGGELEFNVSHSGDCVAIAMTDGSPVGVDAECEKPMSDPLTLADHFFAREEAEFVKGAATDHAAATFYSIWTAKESVIKAAGGGLSIDLSSFVVTPADCLTPVQNRSGSPELDGWWVLALPRIRGCHAAVAARGSNWTAVLHEFQS
ncbi:MAG TPA: 4'-phosphopantetheinyl transferase superfamily protein [Thermoanaerobaculia bacterium]